MLEFDHAIVVVRDLARAADRLLSKVGLASVEGGRHPGHGTANRIVPLGPDYLELLGVADETEARTSPFGRWALRRQEQGDGLAALCYRTSDLESLASRLGLKPLAMFRNRPDGTRLEWLLAGLEEALTERPLPFFIQWKTPPQNWPGRADAPHRIEPRGLGRVQWRGEAERLRSWLGREPEGCGLSVSFEPAAPEGPVELSIRTADGEIGPIGRSGA